jgi:hypothetical protein
MLGYETKHDFIKVTKVHDNKIMRVFHTTFKKQLLTYEKDDFKQQQEE